MKPSELAAWIRSMLARGARRFFLRQVIWGASGGETMAPVATYDAQETREADDVATQAMSDAREDAKDTGGAQRYALVAYNDGEQVARKVWRVAGERLSEEAGPTEPPNAIGVTAQLMRHNEASARLAHAAIDATFGRLEAMLSRALEHNERLAAREAKVIERLEALSTAKHERKLERLRIASQLETRTRALAHLEPVIPVIISKLFKLPLSPADAPPALDALLASITPDQHDALMRVLTPEQTIALGEIWQERNEVLQKAAAEKERRAAITNGTTNGTAKGEA